MCISDNAGALLPVAKPAEEAVVQQHDQAAAYLRAFGLPDVSKIDLSKISAADKATCAVALQSQLSRVRDHVAALCAPVSAMIATCEADVFNAIREAKGTMLPHDTLDVKLVAPTSYEPDVAKLRELQQHLSPGEIGNGVERKRIVIKSNLDDAAIAKLREFVGMDVVVEEWGTHAGTLNRLATKYGPESEVGKIIAAGLRKVQGMSRLSIAERAMRPSELAMARSQATPTEEADAIAEHEGAA